MTAISAPAPRRRLLDWRAIPLGVALPLLYVLLVLVLTVFGNFMMPYSPAAQDLYRISAPPSAEHWFGTDDLGRDVLSRLIAGARTAIVGPLVVALTGFIGSSLIGIYAGYSGGTADNAIMRVVDFVIAMPSLLIAIVLVSVLGGGYWLAIAVLSLLNLPGDIRIVRGAALKERNLAYIEAARAIGVPKWRIMYYHILPNIMALQASNFAINVAGSLVALAGLAFLGLGSELGTPEWGSMLADGQALLFSNPAAALAPAGAIILLALSVNLVGDWAYDRYTGR
ncbi:MAG: ABC transporter permease [Hyphomicrobiales bacterium]|nr:MAG: ABC transporter permease [Hyphomicrobiales bacterium]